jgi:hypothetical protein
MAAARRDLNSIAADLVMKVLDGVAERATDSDTTPSTVRKLADAWESIGKDDRGEIAKYIAMGVQGALAVVPVAVASASRRVRKTVKRKSADAVDDAKDKKKKKKDKKDKKKKKKKDKKKK